MATTSASAPVPSAPNGDLANGKSAQEKASPDTAAQEKDLIQMRALTPSELPPHPSLSNETSAVTLAAFASSLLTQGSAFLTTELGAGGSFRAQGRPRASGGSAAQVQVYAFERRRPGGGARPEPWFARVSRHEAAARRGCASLAEFDFGLRQDHSRHEGDYTPDVFDANVVLEYGAVEGVPGWESVEVSVVEMAHRIPFPLLNRVFAVVVVTGKSNDGFVVVQVPVRLEAVQAARYSNGANKKDASLKGLQKKGVVIGEYVSIERCRQEGNEIVWEMATASDAKGSLPMALQKPALPGKITLDVGLFIDWIEKQRTKKEATNGH